MLIALSSSGRKLSSEISFYFGRSPYFLILDEKGILEEVVSREEEEILKGLGIDAAWRMVERKVDVVITGDIGVQAFDILKENHVKVYATQRIEVREAFRLFEDNKLEQVTGATRSGNWGRGKGRGIGKIFGGDRGERGFGFNPQKDSWE